MKEVGKIIEINGGMAKILIVRHTACGNCGACQVGRENLNMILTTENTVGGKPGDLVEIELKTENFLYASFIMYGIPLIGLIIGLLGGYYGGRIFGYDENISQIIAAITGILFMSIGYICIKALDPKIKRMNKFKPVLIRLVND
ncbi:MAG TPA: SoxR reducing system RseC family protein [Clostridiales bacterium]|nr:SoxR reducing system RseC family protein [Clostridiales bacterium]